MDRIPILRMGGFLLVTIQVDMHDQLAMTLQDDLTNRIAEVGAKGVLIDISSLEIVDCLDGQGTRRGDGSRRHAASRCDYAGRTGHVAARHSHCAQCRVWHAVLAQGSGWRGRRER